MALSLFTPAVSGMDAHAHAMETISTNIANLNTVGYKRSQTMFRTMLGSQPIVKGNNTGLYSSKSDVNGVGVYDKTSVTQQGTVTIEKGAFNAAINGTGNGFFQVNDENGRPFYTRAGSFETRTENGATYLIAPNGYRVQGFKGIDNRGFESSPSDIIINPMSRIPSVPTSKLEITANVPASGVENSSYGITVYGPNNDGKTMNMLFSKVEGKRNTWDVTFTVDGGEVNHQPIEAVFSDTGEFLSPKMTNVTVNWNDDGGSNNIAIDLSHMTQYAGSTGITYVSQDGAESGDFVKSYIDTDGVIKSQYSNNKTVDIAKLTVVGFESPDNLQPISNTMFQANNDCGDSYFVKSGIIVPDALERSTARIEEEFSNMVVIQRAYSLNTQSFTVSDEMLQEAVNIKA